MTAFGTDILLTALCKNVCVYVIDQVKPGSLSWQLPPSCSNGQSKVAAWLQESEEMDKCAEGNVSLNRFCAS